MSQIYPAMTTFSASAMRRQQGMIFETVKKRPILFTHHGHAAGVLVHPDVWNRLLERLEDQADLIMALTVELEAERGEAEFEPADIEALEAMAKGEVLPA